MQQERPELIIEAGRGEQQYWLDLWRYRELFYFLAWRDIMVRYKQAVLGVSWAIIQPLAMTIILTVVFKKIASMPSPAGVPYALVVLAGSLPWQFFAVALTGCGNSLIGNANLLTKVYFPRLVVPTSAVVVAFVDFLISLSIMAVMMIYYQWTPDWKIIFLPLFMLLACGVAMGAGLWQASLNVQYRDVRYIIPFITQFGLYVSPVGFVSDTIPTRYRLLYSLNPMVSVIDGFRWCLLRGEWDAPPALLAATGAAPKAHIYLYWPGLALSTFVVILLLTTSIWYFRKMERTFADVI